jgi:hypothetical protein
MPTTSTASRAALKAVFLVMRMIWLLVVAFRTGVVR